jgi:hypothetical protein
MLWLQEDEIMGGCHNDVISPPESLEMCVDGGGVGLETQALMVHHTYLGFIRSIC